MHMFRWIFLFVSIFATYWAALAIRKEVDEQILSLCIVATGGGDFCGQRWFGPTNFVIHCLWAILFSIVMVMLAATIAPMQKKQTATLIYVLGVCLAITEASIFVDYLEIRNFWPWPESIWPRAVCSILAGGTTLWFVAYRPRRGHGRLD